MSDIKGARLMVPAQITASAATYYTSTACRTRVDAVTLSNPTGTNRLVTLYLIESGGAAGNPTTITYQKTVLAGQTVRAWEIEGHWLNSGDFVQAICDAATAVSMFMSGIKTPAN